MCQELPWMTQTRPLSRSGLILPVNTEFTGDIFLSSDNNTCHFCLTGYIHTQTNETNEVHLQQKRCEANENHINSNFIPGLGRRGA